MKKPLFVFWIAIQITSITMAQNTQVDSLQGKKIDLDEVFVSAIRATKVVPVTF